MNLPSVVVLLASMSCSSLLAGAFLFHEPTQRNVIYGMDHGAALLLDVYVPAEPNGYGVVFIMGTGFTAYGEYDDVPLKELDRWLLENGVFPELMGEKGQLFGPMLDAGFTVFSINHRLAPKNTIWTQVRDCQRAVQYIRHHAERWGIDAGRLGGMGHSSGASMITYLGLLDDVAVADAHDPVDRESSRLQAIVPVSGLHDFSVSAESAGGVSVFMSAVIGRPVTYQPPGHPVYETYARASTLRYASADDATALILHGTADEAVDVKHSVLLAEALTAAGVKNEFIELVGASHAVLLETVDIQPGVYAADWMKRTLIR